MWKFDIYVPLGLTLVHKLTESKFDLSKYQIKSTLRDLVDYIKQRTHTTVLARDHDQLSDKHRGWHSPVDEHVSNENYTESEDPEKAAESEDTESRYHKWLRRQAANERLEKSKGRGRPNLDKKKDPVAKKVIWMSVQRHWQTSSILNRYMKTSIVTQRVVPMKKRKQLSLRGQSNTLIQRVVGVTPSVLVVAFTPSVVAVTPRPGHHNHDGNLNNCNKGFCDRQRFKSRKFLAQIGTKDKGTEDTVRPLMVYWRI